MRFFSSSLYKKSFKFFLINKYFKPVWFCGKTFDTIFGGKNVFQLRHSVLKDS